MLDLSADIIDVRNIIARYEELRDIAFSDRDESQKQEIWDLERVLDDLKGAKDAEHWEGDWYPVTLIRDSYFVTYAQEFAEDIGVIAPGAPWPAYCIDWYLAARELQVDYSTVEIDGIDYWYC